MYTSSRRLFSIGGNSNSLITEVKNDYTYPVGTIVYKALTGGDRKFCVVGEEWLQHGYGQPAIALDLSMTSEVAQNRDKEQGGVGIGSFRVLDETYTQEQVEALRLAFANKRIADQLTKEQKEKETEEKRARGKKIWDAAIPKGVVAVIVANLKEDRSDPMSDYFASGSTRTVILAWSFTDRNDFNEMRKAAARFEGTRYLTEGEDIKKYEHRENYTGGSGYYLGGSKYSGWNVSKCSIGQYSINGLYLDAADAENFLVGNTLAPAPASAAATLGNDAITITTNDEKQGIEIRFASKPDSNILDALKTRKWRWSRFSKCWYITNTEANMAYAKSLVATE